MAKTCPENNAASDTHGFDALAILAVGCFPRTPDGSFDGCGVVTSTCAPGCSLYWPSTTTCSPASNPPSIKAVFASVCATLIGRISTVLSVLMTYAYVPCGPRCTTLEGTTVAPLRVVKIKRALTNFPGQSCN